MIRLAGRAIKHLLLAMLLLVAGLCALEAWLRIARVSRSASAADVEEASALTEPSRTTYLSALPRLRRTVPQTADRGAYRLRTNSFGLRNPEAAVPPDAGVFRILCLGDETTFAADLPENLTYSWRLQEELEAASSTAVEVLNGGCPGGGPTVLALTLRHRLLGLQPDLILLHVDESDLAEEEAILRHVERDGAGRPTAAVHPALAGRGSANCRLVDEFLIFSSLRDQLHGAWKQGRGGSSSQRPAGLVDPTVANGRTSLRHAITAIRDMAEAQSSVLIVATTAVPRTDKASAGARMMSAWPPAELQTMCAELEVPFVDATRSVTAATRQRPAAAQRLNPAGHAAYARALARTVLRRFAGEEAVPEPAVLPETSPRQRRTAGAER
ncbi:MAG: SGNH/GDSL hydrolase family protein [Planctomyces sp.]|nr:SGNH/GDSL hydrolase family protein [Planctomyces sp.]